MTTKYSILFTIVKDGVEAMDFLRNKGKYKTAPKPDLIILDLNLPRKDGREVLAEIKYDEELETYSDSDYDYITG